MLKGATARRYAQAVFDIGVEAGNVDRWRDDVRTIADYLGNKRLLFVLSEPKIPFDRKQAMIRDLLGAKVQPEALNLALLLAERGLAPLAPRISQYFEVLYNDYRGQAVAEVTTAVPLDEDLRLQIGAELQQITGKRILLQERVDPAILGGAIARVGDTLIDGSIRRRFQLLRQQIAAGAFGGPDDGASSFVVAPTGGPNGGPTSGSPVSGGFEPGTGPGNGPATNGGRPTGGPSSSNSAAPRSAGGSAHLPPRQGGNSGNAGKGRNDNKRRRR